MFSDQLPLTRSVDKEMPAGELDLDALNQGFESADPAKIVRWAVTQFDSGLVMSSSFGAESAVLLHMAASLAPRIKVIFVDTGFLFPETHEFMEALRNRFDLNIWTYRTRNDPFKYLSLAGETDPSVRADVDRCCAENKNEPFERAMQELSPRGWLRGIRRNQAQSRGSRGFVEWSRRYGCFAVSPLLNMDRKAIHEYLKHNELPYHPLFEQGYASIGCNPLTCTRPIQPGEDPRSGRWSGKSKIECGINLNNSLDSAQL